MFKKITLILLCSTSIAVGGLVPVRPNDPQARILLRSLYNTILIAYKQKKLEAAKVAMAKIAEKAAEVVAHGQHCNIL